MKVNFQTYVIGTTFLLLALILIFPTSFYKISMMKAIHLVEGSFNQRYDNVTHFQRNYIRFENPGSFHTVDKKVWILGVLGKGWRNDEFCGEAITYFVDPNSGQIDTGAIIGFQFSETQQLFEQDSGDAPMIQDKSEITTHPTTSNIIFRYGSSGAPPSPDPDTFTKHSNELDTFKGIFTKDMVNEDPALIMMDLTQDELDAIYQKMFEIDFFSYPESFHPTFEGSVIGSTDPFLAYYLEYQNETGSKVVYWDTQFVAPEDTQYKNLRELAHLIIEIIQAKPEYKELSEPTAG